MHDPYKIGKLSLVMAITALLTVGFIRYYQRRARDSIILAQKKTITRATPMITKEAMYYKKLKGKKVQCNLCFRNCVIAEGKRGFCRVRENRGGVLISLVHSYPSAVHIDPIEKEPLYHFLPGTDILCIGTVGCNFKCLHCHNWHLSQSSPGDLETYYLPPQKVVELAIKHNIPSISFTYNDPIVAYEYLLDVAKIARSNGINVIMHTNGAINQEPLKELLKYTSAVTVDLKSVDNDILRRMAQGETTAVLETLKTIKEQKVWLELVTLIVTGMNDSEEHITQLCKWVKENLGNDVPLHFSRFFPNYKYTSVIATPIQKLEKAYKIARDTGLNYVSLGNVPGHKYNSTFCPRCDARLIYRKHFQVIENNIVDEKCKSCGHKIAGVWK